MMSVDCMSMKILVISNALEKTQLMVNPIRHDLIFFDVIVFMLFLLKRKGGTTWVYSFLLASIYKNAVFPFFSFSLSPF